MNLFMVSSIWGSTGFEKDVDLWGAWIELWIQLQFQASIQFMWGRKGWVAWLQIGGFLCAAFSLLLFLLCRTAGLWLHEIHSLSAVHTLCLACMYVWWKTLSSTRQLSSPLSSYSCSDIQDLFFQTWLTSVMTLPAVREHLCVECLCPTRLSAFFIPSWLIRAFQVCIQ